MTVKDIASVIEAWAPLGIQEEWDNSGLQTGSPEDEVHGVMVGFDCTEALVEEAVRRGCDMVLTHHPLIFRPLSHIDPRDGVGAAIYAAVRSGVAVYSAHTSADKVPAGVSGATARKLGLENVQILDQEDAGVGLGVVGDLPAPLSAREAVELVKKALGVPAVRTSALIAGPVTRVALCGGSGSSLIGAALRSGAQMYVCGDISYHHFFVPEGFMVVDAGHFETEIEITEVLLSVIRKKFPTFVSLMSECIGGANPVNYL
jgi:dinuclear metal center YbgI/SA1388 family protein